MTMLICYDHNRLLFNLRMQNIAYKNGNSLVKPKMWCRILRLNFTLMTILLYFVLITIWIYSIKKFIV